MGSSDEDGGYHRHRGQCRHLAIVNQNDDDEMDNNRAKHHYYRQQINIIGSGKRTADNTPPLHLHPPSIQFHLQLQSRLSLTKIHRNYNCKLDCMFVPVVGRILSICNQRLQSSLLSFSLITIIMATVVGGVFFNKSIINDNPRQQSQHRKPRQRLRQQTRQSIIMNANKTKPLYNDNHHYYQLQTTKLHRQPDLLFIISSSTSTFCSSTLSVIFHIFFFLLFSSQLILSVSSQPYESTSNAITRIINPGDKVDIPCSVVTPGGSVRWALNNSPIPLDSNQRRYWNISNDGKATLTINRVTKMDAGLWECWKLDGDFKIRQKVPIMKIVLSNVPEEPYLEYEGRLITQHGIISARANNIIKINCVIKGMSSLIRSVQWFIGQANFTHQSRLLMEYSAEEDVSLTISVLTLNVSAKFHHEPIICQISHLSWPNIANVTAVFNVLYPPDFSILREPGFGFPIIEGMDLTFRCEIDANPLSPVKWQRDPDPKISNETMAPIETSPDGTLTISPITLKDIGWYRCTTTNELGFFASIGFFVNVRESTDEMSQLVDQLRSQNPHLTFESSNNFHHRSSSDFAFRKVHDHTNRESHFQALANVGGYNNHQPQVSNKPECPPNINNADGRPIIESINSTVIALVGSQITLIARFCCIPRPKKVYWIHRHLAMMPSRIIGRYITRELIMSSNSMNCFTSNFIIDSVKPEDAGDVMFMVLNQKGIDQALVSLNVTFASYSISNGAISPTSSGISIYHQQNIQSVTVILLLVYILTTIAMNVICSSSNFVQR